MKRPDLKAKASDAKRSEGCRPLLPNKSVSAEMTSDPVPGRIDPGIARAVSVLQENGVETFESCEGGEGHAFPEPTVRFYGTPAAGPHALAVCMNHGLPVMALRRVWYMEYGELTGPNWELVFRTKIGAV